MTDRRLICSTARQYSPRERVDRRYATYFLSPGDPWVETHGYHLRSLRDEDAELRWRNVTQRRGMREAGFGATSKRFNLTIL